MSGRAATLALAVLTVGLPALGAAQGLGDVAARAREDREKRSKEGQETEARTFSNDDLEGLAEKSNEDSVGTVSTPGTPAPDAGGRASGPALTAEQLRQARLRPLEDAVARDQTRVRALEASVEELQQRLNPMSTTYVYGGTGGPVGGNQASEEMRVRRQLAATEQQLEQARQGLAASERALEQARGRPVPVVPREQPAPSPESGVRQRP